MTWVKRAIMFIATRCGRPGYLLAMMLFRVLPGLRQA